MSPPLIPEATSFVFRRQRLAKLRKSLENGYTSPATGVSPSLPPFSRAWVHPGAPLGDFGKLISGGTRSFT